MIRLARRFMIFVPKFLSLAIRGLDGEYLSPAMAGAVAWSGAVDDTTNWHRHEDNLWLATGQRTPACLSESIRAWVWRGHLKRRARRLASRETAFGLVCRLGEREERLKIWIRHSESDDGKIYPYLVTERWMVKEAMWALEMRKQSEKMVKIKA